MSRVQPRTAEELEAGFDDAHGGSAKPASPARRRELDILTAGQSTMRWAEMEANMSSVSKTILLAAALALGAGVPALAQSTHHRGAKHRHHHARAPLVGTGVHVGGGEEAPLYGPRYRNGADDDLSTDGSAIGREGDLVQRDGAPKGYRGPGLELEGPPLYSSLPVVPELYDPSLR